MSTLSNDSPPLLRPEPGPGTLKAVRWGGQRLAALRAAAASACNADEPTVGELPIGESWEFSTLPGSQSRARGRDLGALLGGPLPFLAKLIDTAAPLSIQVHPTDDPARGQLGKEEAWIVLDAAPGAALLAGVVDGIDDAALDAAMRQAICRPEHDACLIEALRRIEVRRGSVLVVPAGTVHAIGPGILLAEIQQPVDCTYRLFDYGSGRPIHPDQARDAWRIAARPVVWHPGDAYRTLAGAHLALRLWGPGEVAIEGGETPRLLVAVGEGVTVHAGVGMDAQPETMRHGDLLLHVHGPLRARVGPHAMLVMGTIAGTPGCTPAP